jgi:hypothetical protein
MRIAIDPSVTATGVAFYSSSGELMHAFTSKQKPGQGVIVPARRVAHDIVERAPFDRYDVSEVLVERPVIYPQRSNQKGDPNDLITLATFMGMLTALVLEDFPHAQVRWVEPRKWKGQLPKFVCRKRIESRLSLDELDSIERLAHSYDHNTWDAVGLGLWGTDRSVVK